jgi:hypothetical protein
MGQEKHDYGTVFRLTPPASTGKGWTHEDLYVFPCGELGGNPEGGLISDSSGALYGTASLCGPNRGGVVFKLTPPSKGQTKWAYSVIFAPVGSPVGNLLPASNGSVVVVTTYAVYNLAPPTAGGTTWTGTILGYIPFTYPTAGAVADSNGVLYFTTSQGGTNNLGLFYSLTPPANGQTGWSETVLHEFQGGANDGAQPNGNLVIDSAGAVYGITSLGGTDNVGTIFRFTPPSGGTGWMETILHNFVEGADGGQPQAGLTIGTNGKFYGISNGALPNAGTIFSIAPAKTGQEWTLSPIYHFPYTSSTSPQIMDGSLIRDAGGRFYGVTQYGGSTKCKQRGCGTVFQVTP